MIAFPVITRIRKDVYTLWKYDSGYSINLKNKNLYMIQD